MYKKVIDFWFSEINQEMWWTKDAEFDNLITTKFGHLHEQAKYGELFEWRQNAEGSLAEVIILDQFSRNIYRNQPESSACDPMALVLAQAAITRGFDLELSTDMRSFLYLPFMHIESKTIQGSSEES